MKKVVKVLTLALIILVLIAGLFLIYININVKGISDLSYLDTYLEALNPEKVSVENVKLFTQPDGFTCGVTSVSVVSSFLENKDITPEALIGKYNLAAGMTTDKFLEVLSSELTGRRITYMHDQKDYELIETLHHQLKSGVPVPVFFGAENPYNKPYYDFHASVVTGLDLDKQEIHILNVYGYEEQISLVEFLNRMSYRDTKNYPLVQRAVLKLGLMDKNSIFIIDPKSF